MYYSLEFSGEIEVFPFATKCMSINARQSHKIWQKTMQIQ